MFGTSKADMEYEKLFETKKKSIKTRLTKQLLGMVLNQGRINKADQARNTWIRNIGTSYTNKIEEV